MAIFNALRWSMMEMASHKRTVHPIFWMLLVLVGEGGIARP
jgi:CHAT domain-containing protein